MENSKQNTMDRHAGTFVVILGPDGSGKSTVVAQLLAESTHLHYGSWRFHWRPGLLPQPGKRPRQTAPASLPPPDKFAYGRVVSMLRYCYFLLDFILGYWLLIYPRCKRGQLVVGERWYFDVLINPQRYGFRLPAWLLRFGGRLIPNPDLTVLLTADAEAIYRRKPELTVNQITTQIAAMRNILPEAPHGAEISTDTSLDESVATLLELLRKTSQRLRNVDVWRAFPRFGETKVLISNNDPVKAALQLYNPYSLAGRAVKKLASLLPRKLTTCPLVSETRYGNIKAISQLIRTTLGNDDLIISLATGTPGPHRKITAQVRHNGQVIAYVKIAQSTAAIELLKREAIALSGLTLQANDRIVTPHVIAVSEQDSCHLLFISAPETSSRARPIGVDGLDFSFIESMTPTRPEVIPLDTIWKSLFREEHIGENVVQDVRLTLETLVGSTGIRVAPAHGDYAPWNTLYLDDGRLFVFDWEYSISNAPLMSDLFQRIFMPDWLVHRLSPAAATNRLINIRADNRLRGLLDRLDMKENEFSASMLLYLLRQGLRNYGAHEIPEYIRTCLRYAITHIENPDCQAGH